MTSGPIITGLAARPVTAPLTVPHKTASGTLEVAPLVLIDIATSAGVTGVAYVFTYTPAALAPTAAMLRNMAPLIEGQPAAPRAIKALLDARFRLVGTQGLVAMAIAGIDMALWDAAARICDQPLATHLGGVARPVPVYDSLGQMTPEETARAVEASLETGHRAFKIKAGHPDPRTDAAAIATIRDVAGADVFAAMDFNQAFRAAEAIRRMEVIDEVRPDWLEEPVAYQDNPGHAEVRASITTPVQTGENWWGLAEMRAAIAAGASDHVMPDVMKIGGVTGFMDAASLASTENLPLSSHLFAEVSAHLMALAPTGFLLEWMDVAGALLVEPPRIVDGLIHPIPGAGNGMTWDEDAVARYGA